MLQATGLTAVLLLAFAANGAGQSVPSLDHARLLMREGKAQDAQRELNALASLTPEPAGVERLRGILSYQNQHLPDADAAFAKAVEQDPSDLDSLQMRGVVLFRMGKAAEAIPLLEKVHARAPIANADPNYVLALCYLRTARYDDARHAFAAQYGFQPDSAPAWLVTARMMFREDMAAPAAAAVRKAIELDPRLPLAHRLLGEIRLGDGDVPGAIAELEKELAVNPLDGETYDRLGDAYVRSGKFSEAQQVLDRAVLLEPNATGPYILLGKALLEQQDPATAAMYLERAARMDPSNSMAHMLLARALTATGRRDEASREFAILQKLHQVANAAPAPNQ